MKPAKFLMIVAFVTFFSLIYVWQQTEIFRLAYLGQKSVKLCDDLLDKNATLRYNIYTSSSLIHIYNKVSETADFQMPDTYRLVRLTHSREPLIASKQLPKKENIVSRLFGIKRQAEAKTINR